MPGRRRYEVDQVWFVLNRLIAKVMSDDEIIAAYRKEYKKPNFGKSQLKYIRTNYGYHPDFGVPLLNTPIPADSPADSPAESPASGSECPARSMASSPAVAQAQAQAPGPAQQLAAAATQAPTPLQGSYKQYYGLNIPLPGALNDPNPNITRRGAAAVNHLHAAATGQNNNPAGSQGPVSPSQVLPLRSPNGGTWLPFRPEPSRKRVATNEPSLGPPMPSPSPYLQVPGTQSQQNSKRLRIPSSPRHFSMSAGSVSESSFGGSPGIYGQGTTTLPGFTDTNLGNFMPGPLQPLGGFGGLQGHNLAPLHGISNAFGDFVPDMQQQQNAAPQPPTLYTADNLQGVDQVGHIYHGYHDACPIQVRHRHDFDGAIMFFDMMDVLLDRQLYADAAVAEYRDADFIAPGIPIEPALLTGREADEASDAAPDESLTPGLSANEDDGGKAA